MATRPSPTRVRVLLAGAIVLLVLPGLASGLAQLEQGDRLGNLTAAENVTYVSTQGSFGPIEDGRVVAIDTDTRRIVWEYSAGGPTTQVSYYDVDPLSSDELLVVEHVEGEGTSAMRVDWRDDEVLDRFAVPPDTHDVDSLGDGTYVVADKYHHRAYVYDPANDSITWEYNFSDHWPEYPAAGSDPSTQPSGVQGYTHLNDVDVVDGGDAFLLSPRNFDRVILVDRETKETEFVLGAEDDYDVLYEQHNPDLLSLDPPTVLVADSENDRVVEYRRDDSGNGSGGEWTRTWQYAGRLHWPRDADRLPNGNTLITDTYGQRVLEVTPTGEPVWVVDVPKMPYDAERLGLPPGSAGPPMNLHDTWSEQTGSTLPIERQVYLEALWIVPAWVGMAEFYGLLAGIGLGLLWAGGEVVHRLRRR